MKNKYLIQNIIEDWSKAITYITVVEVPEEVDKDDYLKNLALYDAKGKTYEITMDDFDIIRNLIFKGEENFPEDIIGNTIDISIVKISQTLKNKFKIFEKDNKQFIERLVYPRYIGEITFGKDSDIENIEILDELFLKNMNVQFLAMALREAADYILLNDKTNP